MTDLLFYGNAEHSAAMRHELPVAIMDPFLLAVVGGRTHVMVNGIERDRVTAAAPEAILWARTRSCGSSP
jgi:Xaa-Pro aminopeptidase